MKYSGRSYRFVLLVRCLIRALFAGKADKVPAQISKIIVVPTGKLGDVVCNTPVLSAIRQNLPQVQIIVAGTSKLHRPILADSGLVDEYLDLEESGAVARLKQCGAEVAVVTGPSFTSVALLVLSGIPLVIAPTVVGGFSPAETRLYKILKRFIRTFPYQIGQYAPRERLRALEAVGIFTEDTKKHLGFSDLASRKAEKFFVDNNVVLNKDFVVGLSLSAGNKIKEWPVERFAQVADYLYKKYQAKVLIIGGKSDHEKTKEFFKFSETTTQILDTTGAFNLDELKALISKLSLFVSVDTGPIYIAEAFDVPTINIVGPVDENVQPPRGLIHRNVLPPNRERAELSILNARSYDETEARGQVLATAVAMVIGEIDKLMKDLY